MKHITIAALAGTAVLFAGTASAQQGVDFSKVEITTVDLGNKTYMLQGQGGNITVAVGSDGIIMVDSQFAPLHDKIKAAITKISPLPVKYLVNTHYHGDHTGGNAAFQKEGATIVGHDNIRVRLAAGTTNGLTGNKTPPADPATVPTQTWQVGGSKVEVGGRVAQLNHTINAHTDGDTWAYFADANVLSTGDTFSRNYPNLDWGNGGTIDGMILANETYIKAANDSTKIVPGHGALATKANLQEFHDMLVTSRDRVKKLFDEGKTEEQVLAAKPLADLDGKWGSAQGLGTPTTWLRNVYNSLRNHN
jgi:glyoxylase-like metal-dependent hydrolase (beta-lactamase superfamily II)